MSAFDYSVCARLHTYFRVAHGSHNAVGTGIESALNHPLLSPGHPDDGAGILMTNGVIEL